MPLCGDAMNLPFSFLDEKMDIGVVSHNPNEPRDDKAHGSANLKPQRSGLARDSDNTDWRPSKMPRPAGEVVGFSAPFGRSNLWPSPEDDDGQKMLSFSSEEHRSGGGSSRSIAFSVCQDEYHSRNGGGMRGPFARIKGPFSPSQWMELEHQALIYKHIMANVPVPSSLLLPLKRSLYSYGPPGSYASNLLGWGPFHLGFSGSNDPEPGRCRRTDGKKWRCSRDAVPDQKYCERHINRGRHRSRKPVEGHTSGHATRVVASSSASAPPTVQPKVPPAPINVSSSSSPVISLQQHQFNALQQQQQQKKPDSACPSTDNLVNSRSQGFQGLSLVSPVAATSPKDMPPFSIPKPTHITFQESEFGIVSSDSLLNPSERISYMNTTNNNNSNSNSFLLFEDKEESSNQTHPVHHFIDDWPKDQSESDWTQLSMSIPTPRLSRELDPMIRMSLGVGHNFNEAIHKQPSWSPVTWGGQVGGPLGEVLSSQVGSSPTGVLQRTTFVSLSNNSSSLSSPRTSGDNKRALDCDLLGSALV